MIGGKGDDDNNNDDGGDGVGRFLNKWNKEPKAELDNRRY